MEIVCGRGGCSPGDTFPALAKIKARHDEAPKRHVATEHVILVLDVSLSMRGTSMDTVQKTMASYFLNDGAGLSKNTDVTVTVVVFADKTKLVLHKYAIDAQTRNTVWCSRVLPHLEATGKSTNLGDAMRHGIALAVLAAAEDCASLVRLCVLTDGNPTSGTRDAEALRSETTKALHKAVAQHERDLILAKISVGLFGVGPKVNVATLEAVEAGVLQANPHAACHVFFVNGWNMDAVSTFLTQPYQAMGVVVDVSASGGEIKLGARHRDPFLIAGKPRSFPFEVHVCGKSAAKRGGVWVEAAVKYYDPALLEMVSEHVMRVVTLARKNEKRALNLATENLCQWKVLVLRAADTVQRMNEDVSVRTNIPHLIVAMQTYLDHDLAEVDNAAEMERAHGLLNDLRLTQSLIDANLYDRRRYNDDEDDDDAKHDSSSVPQCLSNLRRSLTYDRQISDFGSVVSDQSSSKAPPPPPVSPLVLPPSAVLERHESVPPSPLPALLAAADAPPPPRRPPPIVTAFLKETRPESGWRAL